jgi:hypothetical protein
MEFVISNGLENLCAFITPADDVIKRSCKVDPRLPCHGKFPSYTHSLVNAYLFMPPSSKKGQLEYPLHMKKRGHPIFPLSREKIRFAIIES